MGEHFGQDNEPEEMLYPGKSCTHAGTSLETGVTLVCVGSRNQDDNQSSRQHHHAPPPLLRSQTSDTFPESQCLWSASRH